MLNIKTINMNIEQIALLSLFIMWIISTLLLNARTSKNTDVLDSIKKLIAKGDLYRHQLQTLNTPPKDISAIKFLKLLEELERRKNSDIHIKNLIRLQRNSLTSRNSRDANALNAYIRRLDHLNIIISANSYFK